MGETLTDLIKLTVTEELERQRAGLDGLKGIREVAISVNLPPMPSRARDVVVHVKTGR